MEGKREVDSKARTPVAVFAMKRVEPHTVYRCIGLYKGYVQADNPRKRYKGVCGGVRKAYYPRGSQFPGAAMRATGGASTKATRGGPKGMQLGKLLDRQLAAATETMTREGTTVLQYLVEKVPLVRYGAPGGKGTPPMSIHHRTRCVLQFLHTMQWHPVACQAPVCCSATRRATMVDLVCIDLKTNRIVLLELKSGYSAGYTTGTAFLEAPFVSVPDTMLNRHQLQHMLTSLLFCITYALKLEAVHAAIVRVDDTAVHHHQLEPWVVAAEGDFRRRFLTPTRRGRAREAATTAPSVRRKRASTAKAYRRTAKRGRKASSSRTRPAVA